MDLCCLKSKPREESIKKQRRTILVGLLIYIPGEPEEVQPRSQGVLTSYADHEAE